MDFRQHIRDIAQRQKILEIGPSYNPIINREDGFDVKIMDHATRDELIAKYQAFGVDTSKIGDVDFVTTDLAEVAGTGETFDVVIASHVIEHTTDIIQFLADCEKALSPGGKVVLIVPDKRFSFDYFRPLSTAGHMIDAHTSGRTRHIGALFDHYSFFCRRDQQLAWGERDTFEPEFLHSTEMSRGPVDTVLKTGEYLDAHEWVFTPNSFRFAMNELRLAGFSKFGIEFFHPSLGYEFLAILSPAAAPDTRDKKEQLFAIEADMREVTLQL